MASFHLIVPPTLGTICLVWNCGQVGERGLVSFQAITHALRPAGNSKSTMCGRQRCQGQVAARKLCCPFKGFGSEEPFIDPAGDNPQPAARVSQARGAVESGCYGSNPRLLATAVCPTSRAGLAFQFSYSCIGIPPFPTSLAMNCGHHKRSPFAEIWFRSRSIRLSSHLLQTTGNRWTRDAVELPRTCEQVRGLLYH